MMNTTNIRLSESALITIVGGKKRGGNNGTLTLSVALSIAATFSDTNAKQGAWLLANKGLLGLIVGGSGLGGLFGA